MSCHRHQSTHRGGRVLCFECYVKRAGIQPRASILFAPFRRDLSRREAEHRRQMLQHLEQASGSSSAQ